MSASCRSLQPQRTGPFAHPARLIHKLPLETAGGSWQTSSSHSPADSPDGQLLKNG